MSYSSVRRELRRRLRRLRRHTEARVDDLRYRWDDFLDELAMNFDDRITRLRQFSWRNAAPRRGVPGPAVCAGLAAAMAVIPLVVLVTFLTTSVPIQAVPAANMSQAAALPNPETVQSTRPTSSSPGRLSSEAATPAGGETDQLGVDHVDINHEDTDVMVDEAAKKLKPGTVQSVVKPGQGVLGYPVTGPVTSNFGMRFHPILRVVKLHTGTDFGTGCGAPVGASADGVVSFVGWGGGYGNRVVIDHGVVGGRKLQTTYNHLSAFAVRHGDVVKQGRGIALSGTTGYSTGCHLHFEVMLDGQFVDPLPYLSGKASPSNPIPDSELRQGDPGSMPSGSPSGSPSPGSSATEAGTPSSSPSSTRPMTSESPSTAPSSNSPSSSSSPSSTSPTTSTPSSSTPSSTSPTTSTPSNSPSSSQTPSAPNSSSPTASPSPSAAPSSSAAPTQTSEPTKTASESPREPSSPQTSAKPTSEATHSASQTQSSATDASAEG